MPLDLWCRLACRGRRIRLAISRTHGLPNTLLCRSGAGRDQQHKTTRIRGRADSGTKFWVRAAPGKLVHGTKISFVVEIWLMKSSATLGSSQLWVRILAFHMLTASFRTGSDHDVYLVEGAVGVDSSPERTPKPKPLRTAKGGDITPSPAPLVPKARRTSKGLGFTPSPVSKTASLLERAMASGIIPDAGVGGVKRSVAAAHPNETVGNAKKHMKAKRPMKAKKPMKSGTKKFLKPKAATKAKSGAKPLKISSGGMGSRRSFNPWAELGQVLLDRCLRRVRPSSYCYSDPQPHLEI